MLLGPRGRRRGAGVCRDALLSAPGVAIVDYTDGREVLVRDRRGRVVCHLRARSGMPPLARYYTYRRVDGRVRRVRVSREEWSELYDGQGNRRQRPHEAATGPGTAMPGRNAIGLGPRAYEDEDYS